MSRGVRWFFCGSVVLVTLAGCGRSYFQYEARAPWRREAEVACLNSGAVKESAGLVRISPIEGPGMCGADFPLKVAMLGEGSALGYVDEPVRPPGAVPNGGHPVAQPRWPVSQQRYSAPAEPQYAPPPNHPGAPMSIEAPGTIQPVYSQQPYPREQVLGAPPSNLQAPPDWQRDRQPSYNQSYSPAPSRRAAAPPLESDDV